MTSDWRIRELENEIDHLRILLREAIEERDRARETATRLEQELFRRRLVDRVEEMLAE